MELRHVRVCLALAEELHFGRTAARLRVAQSAVSQTIKDLEEELGVALFQRSKRSVTITQAGEHYLASAREALQALERGVQASRAAAGGHAGRLRLRFTLMSGLTVLPRAIARFQRLYPKVEVTIAPGSSADLFAALESGDCHIGFVSLKKDVTPLATEVVERDDLVLLIPTHYGLGRRRSVGFRDLAAEKFIFLKRTSEPQVHAYFRRRCLDAGFEPNIVMEIEQVDVLLAVVAAGMGIACVPGLVRRLGFKGVKTVPITPRIDSGISAVWDPRTLPATGQRFLALLREEPRAGRT
jgi:DNA-binding transcriptional LysR family regulator